MSNEHFAVLFASFSVNYSQWYTGGFPSSSYTCQTENEGFCTLIYSSRIAASNLVNSQNQKPVALTDVCGTVACSSPYVSQSILWFFIRVMIINSSSALRPVLSQQHCGACGREWKSRVCWQGRGSCTVVLEALWLRVKYMNTNVWVQIFFSGTYWMTGWENGGKRLVFFHLKYDYDAGMDSGPCMVYSKDRKNVCSY